MRICRFLFLLLCFILTGMPAYGTCETEASHYYDGYAYTTYADGVMIQRYEGTDAVVRVPAKIGGLPVMAIGSRAFTSNENIWAIILPDTVVELQHYAFDDCRAKIVILPATLEIIGFAAFSRSDITSIYIPNSVRDMGENAFASCLALSDVYFDADIPMIPPNSFFECVNLRSIKLPDNLEHIGEEAFYYCISLEEISFPASMQRIDNHAFAYVPLWEINLNNDVILGEGVFLQYNDSLMPEP